jgi:hypothetical protein
MLAVPWQRLTLVAFLFVAAGASAATASTIIDLGSSNSGSANGALYEWTDFGPTGTGNIDSFLRIQGNGTERGYNHSLGGQVPWDTKAGLFTHDIQYKDLVVRTVLGVDYYEFLLDINEAASADKRWLSLDNVQIFTRSGPITSGPNEDFSDLGTLRYNNDAGGDVTVNLDYTRNNGSGSGDMFLLVPAALFSDVLPDDYVYFYSEFGGLNSSDAGFEEWALRRQVGGVGGGGGGVPENPAPVPEPGSMLLLGTGLLFAARKFGRA